MRVLFITLLCLIGVFSSKAQDVKFTVVVSMDSVLMGNYFQVTFKIEEGEADNFNAPNFQGFAIVGGPNKSVSVNITNGIKSQSMSYSYFLQPIEEGQFFIEPASVEIDGNIFETQPVEIKVAPNPDGIIQQPSKQRNRTFDSFFERPLIMPNAPEQKKKKPKKKRKTVKI